MEILDLKSLVQEVRRQLEQLDQERRDRSETALLELESFELEIKFTVEEKTGQRGGLDIKIISGGLEKAQRSEAVQSVKIRYRVAETAKFDGLIGSRAHSSVAERQKGSGITPLE